ncbi:hypothetical protein [uncultured Sphingomonas sp.]|uniref:hypothetical protein n=1 Tax=uncultured Sphingomonas sp. TaxID=158754 RepID=UPI0037493820
MTDNPLVEAVAKGMADAAYKARLSEIKASWATDRPISLNGPVSFLEYYLSAEEWECQPHDYVLKAQYRDHATAALRAIEDAGWRVVKKEQG